MSYTTKQSLINEKEFAKSNFYSAHKAFLESRSLTQRLERLSNEAEGYFRQADNAVRDWIGAESE